MNNIYWCFLIFFNITFIYATKKCRLGPDDKACYKGKVTKVLNENNVQFVDRKNSNSQSVRLFGLQSLPLEKNFRIYVRTRLKKLLYKKNLKLIIKKKRDKFGVMVGVFYDKNININKKMIIDGYAWCFKRYSCRKSYIEVTLRSSKGSPSKSISKKPEKIKIKGPKKSHKSVWKKPKKIKIKKGSKKKKLTNSGKENDLVRVIKVIDGDTVNVRSINSLNSPIIKVRMSGIDAPELKQDYGLEAKQKLQKIIDNQKSTTFTLIVQGIDIYGRSLGTILAGNEDINKQLVESGYAWCYKYKQCPISYQRAMENAKKKRLGLFIQENPMTPWTWRYNNKKNNSKLD